MVYFPLSGLCREFPHTPLLDCYIPYNVLKPRSRRTGHMVPTMSSLTNRRPLNDEIFWGFVFLSFIEFFMTIFVTTSNFLQFYHECLCSMRRPNSALGKNTRIHEVFEQSSIKTGGIDPW